MFSLNDGAGLLIIDHTNSPGLSPADVAHVPGAVAVGAGAVFERDTKTCSHCQRDVLLNPGRVRARAVCLKCYSYICDGCEAIRAKTGECVPMVQRIDQAVEIVEKFVGQPDHPDANPDIVLTDI